MKYPQGNGRKDPQMMEDRFVGLSRRARAGSGSFADCMNMQSGEYPCCCTADGYEDATEEAVIHIGDDATHPDNIQYVISLDGGFSGVADGKFYWKGDEITYPEGTNYTIDASSKIHCIEMQKYIYVQELKENGRTVLYKYDPLGRSVTKVNDGQYGGKQENITVAGQVFQGVGGDVYHLMTVDSVSRVSDPVYILFMSDIAATRSWLDSLENDTEIVIHGLLEDNEAMTYPETGLEKPDEYTAIRCRVKGKYSGTKLSGKYGVLNAAGDDYIEGADFYENANKRARYVEFINIDGKRVIPEGWGRDNNDVNAAENSILTKAERFAIPLGGVYLQVVPQSGRSELYKNRIWTAAKLGTSINASAFGIGENFYDFDGIATDSVEIATNSHGEYLGVYPYNNALLAFKQNNIDVVYGDTPSDFSLGKTIEGIGTIDIRSCKVVEGVLYFCGGDGFYAYTGGQPQYISDNLNTRYTECIAYEKDGKYFAESKRIDGVWETVVYDTRKRIFYIEEARGIIGSFDENGERYIYSKDHIYKVLHGYETFSGSWYIETNDMFEDVMDEKAITEIYIRIKTSGRFTVKTSINGYEMLHKSFVGCGNIRTYRIPVKRLDADCYRIRVEGNAPAVIYAIERKVSVGGRNIKE